MAEDTRTRIAEVRAQIRELAPSPPEDGATAQQVAAYAIAEAQVSWARMMSLHSDVSMTDIAIVHGMFAAAHALLALAKLDAARADEAAAQIWDAWNDGGGVGEWLWEHETSLGIDSERLISLADELASLNAQEKVPS